MVLKYFKAGKKIKDAMLKVKPLSERNKFGKKNAKDMKDVMEMRKENVKTQQSLNKARMERGMETQPLRSSVKEQIQLNREARAKKIKNLKKDAAFVGGVTGAGGATIAGIKKYEDSKKERVGKKEGGSPLTEAKRKYEPLGPRLGKPSGKKEILKEASKSESMNRKVGFKSGGCVQLRGWGKARKR